MRDVVSKALLPFTELFEGKVAWMYLDSAGFVTTAYGNLLRTVDDALSLSWFWAGNPAKPATQEEIAWAYSAVARSSAAAAKGHLSVEGLTGIRLSDIGMSRLLHAKMASNETLLMKRFIGFEDVPACAQLALLSWAWAVGTNARFPKMQRAWNEGKWDLVEKEIYINETLYGPDGKPLLDSHGKPRTNAGLVPRNKANKILVANVMPSIYAGNYDILEYEHELPKGNPCAS